MNLKKMSILAVGAVFMQADANDGGACYHATNGSFFSIGGGVNSTDGGELVEFIPEGEQKYTESSSHHNRLGATFLVAIGKNFTNGFHAALEALVDIARNNDHTHADKATADIDRPRQYTYDLHTKRNCFSSDVTLKLGYKHCSGATIYCKAGGTFGQKITETYRHWGLWTDISSGVDKHDLNMEEPSIVKISKITPIFGVGVEKAFGNNMAWRAEAVYRLSQKKKKKFGVETLEFTKKGDICFRILTSYNIKIGN